MLREGKRTLWAKCVRCCLQIAWLLRIAERSKGSRGRRQGGKGATSASTGRGGLVSRSREATQNGKPSGHLGIGEAPNNGKLATEGSSDHHRPALDFVLKTFEVRIVYAVPSYHPPYDVY